MPFLTRSELERRPLVVNGKGADYYHTKASTDRHLIFLSHCHKDRDILKEFVVLLGEQAFNVYVDWADETMPEKCSGETAARIKGKIHECNKFVLLATNNACASRWCPWELGIADDARRWQAIVVAPVADNAGHWTGNEYIQVYKYVDKDWAGALWVVNPLDKTRVALGTWITS